MLLSVRSLFSTCVVTLLQRKDYLVNSFILALKRRRISTTYLASASVVSVDRDSLIVDLARSLFPVMVDTTVLSPPPAPAQALLVLAAIPCASRYTTAYSVSSFGNEIFILLASLSSPCGPLSSTSGRASVKRSMNEPRSLLTLTARSW